MKMRWLIPGLLVATTMMACDSKDNLLGVRDGAAGALDGPVAGLGGAGAGGAVISGGSTGSAGVTTAGISGGAVGSGGIGGGTGGSKTDAAPADTAGDAPLRSDGGDVIVECAPGYPVGASRPSSDGCGTCICTSGGVWGCSGAACQPDARTDAPSDAPSDGSLPVPDGRAVDTGVAACSALTTEADCRTRSDCHPLFSDPRTCGCATLGCCAVFSKCAEGKADCKVPAQFTCTMPQPYCEGPYVLAYRAGCYEGCVRSTDCGGSLSTCSPAPVCATGEIPIRVQQTSSSGQLQCACEPNPCADVFPSCDCAGALCTKYAAECVAYAPGSGQLVCTAK